MLDLNLTTIFLEAGQVHRDLPGLYALVPKKTARLRAADRLVLLLSQTSGTPAPSYSPLPPNLQQELLTRLAETYFTSTGSVTAGMKAMAERLNEFLINRNLRQSRQQTAQVVGLLNMAVVHGEFIYIAQAGPMHAYVINGDKVEHFTDSGGPARGLGLARLVNLRFFQAQVGPGSSLILCVEPPPAWKDAALRSASALDLGDMRGALIGDELNLEGTLVRFSTGRGDVRLSLPVAVSPVVAPPPVSQPETTDLSPTQTTQPPDKVEPDGTSQGVYLSGKSLDAEPSAEPQMISGEPVIEAVSAAILLPSGLPEAIGIEEETERAGLENTEDTGEIEPVKTGSEVDYSNVFAELPPLEEQKEIPLAGAQSVEAEPEVIATRSLSGAERAALRAAQAQKVQAPPPPARVVNETKPAAESTDAIPKPTERRQKPPSAAAAGAAHAANGMIGGVRHAGAWIAATVNRLIARALPDQPTEGMHLSATTMLFIALAVPVLVVAVSATVYFRRGRGEMHIAAVLTAQQFADRAVTQSDTTLQREDWNQAISWLDQAEKYGTSVTYMELRKQTQAGIDTLDGYTRVDFRPALSGTLGEGVLIKRMIPVVNDVYLLEANGSRVLRIFRSGQGYEVDTSFVCSPGDYGGGTVTIGPLVDITTLPAQNFVHAEITGIDAQGNVLFCQPGEIPSAQKLVPPDVNWGSLTHAVHLQGVLYVLDTQMNQVYRYFYNDTEGNYVGAPGIYFDLQVPRLGDVIDLAVDQEYLYLLHADGSMTTCNSSGASTQCQDPAPYGDSREGKPSDPLTFEDANFILMQSTQPPDPSLYILDTLGPSVYNFSHRRLNLQNIYQPLPDTGYPPADKAPQAFVITPNRRLILAVDNLLYMGALP